MPEFEQKPVSQIAGNVGRDPEVKKGPYGEFVVFSLATTRMLPTEMGGSDGETRWYDVSVNKEWLQEWVLENVHKGSRIAVEGFPRKEEYEGRPQYRMSAFRVGAVDWAVSDSPKPMRPTKAEQARQASLEDDDDF